ncbi:hypothetical protein ACFFK0_22640 [Paenibacillus chartarius]|uniref:Uncharacterized protein n=1 Tax=Paenibacillus chartarius TaxID=747481 RepID=A0ABV6DRC0_9BACL
MSKRSWTKPELSRLLELARECPPSMIASELNRPVTSVRKKMREIGVEYVNGTEWRIKQINRIISDETPQPEIKRPAAKNYESEVLDEFWRSLLSMARIAKKTGRQMDVLAFINTYRKISR